MAGGARAQALTWITVALFAAVYANLAWLTGFPVIFGALAGALAGGVPAWLGRDGQKLARLVGVGSLALVAVVVAGMLLPLLFSGQAASMQKSAPLFVAALALYAHCLYHERRRDDADRAQTSLRAEITRALAAPPFIITLCVAVIMAAYLLFLLWFVAQREPGTAWLTSKFLERGVIPPLTLLLFCWGLLLLANKWIKGRGAFRALPWMLNTPRARAMLDEHWLLARQKIEEGHLIPRYISWAIPILGFVGTVLGISLASAGIQRIIGSNQGLSALGDKLGEAIAPLGIAFDTTLIALSLSLALTLLQTLLQRWEEARHAEIAHALYVRDELAP